MVSGYGGIHALVILPGKRAVPKILGVVVKGDFAVAMEKIEQKGRRILHVHGHTKKSRSVPEKPDQSTNHNMELTLTHVLDSNVSHGEIRNCNFAELKFDGQALGENISGL